MKSLAFSLLIATMLSLSFSVLSANALTPTEIQGIVVNSGIFPKGSRCSTAVKGNQIHVTVPRKASETENDMKISTLVLAKRLMDKDPNIRLVRVYYLERTRNKAGLDDEKYTFFDASASNVEGFVSGASNKETLLASIVPHVYVNASTMQSVIEKTVGPGPLYGDRSTVQSELFVRSGGDTTDLGQILPTVDQFANRMKLINEMAHLNKPAPAIQAELNKLRAALDVEVKQFQLLQETNPQKAELQVEKYKATHGLGTAAKKPSSTQVNLPGIKTAQAINPNVYAAVAQRYPELIANERYPLELDHRKGLSRFLISRFAIGKGTEADLDDFKRIEYFASQDERSRLKSLFFTTENRLGYRYVPNSGN